MTTEHEPLRPRRSRPEHLVPALPSALELGVHAFRDSALTEEFATEPLRIDVGEAHPYAVDRRPGSLVFAVDGTVVRELPQAPDYPVQLMLGVFAFPHRHPESVDDSTPELVVTRVRGRPPG